MIIRTLLTKKRKIVVYIFFIIICLLLYYILNESQLVNMIRVNRAIKSKQSENIIPFLEVNDRYVQLTAVRALGELNDQKSVEALRQISQNSLFQEVQIGCINIMSRLKSKYSLESLMGLLVLNNELVRLHAVRKINKIIEYNTDNVNKLKQWWQENQKYLYWSDKENYFVIDQEAKAAGIPTEEYRQTHPWPKEQEPDKQDEPNRKDSY